MLAQQFTPLFQACDKPTLSAFRSWFRRMNPRKELALALFDQLRRHHGKPKSKNPLPGDETGNTTKSTAEVAEPKRSLLSDEAAHEIIFGRPLATLSDRKNLSNLYGDLRQGLEDFLLWEEVRRPSFEQDLLRLRLLDRLHDGGVAHLDFLEKCKSAAETEPAKDEWQYFKRLIFNHLAYFDVRTDKYDPSSQSLARAGKHLDDFHRILCFKYDCETLNRSRILPKQRAPDRRKKALVPLPAGEEAPLKIYRLMHELITEGKPEAYQSLEVELKQNHARLADEVVVSAMMYLLNHLIKQPGDEAQLQKHAYELNRWGDEQGIFLKFEYIDSQFFNNAVVTGCKLRKFGWVEDFIEKYRHHLLPDPAQVALVIAQADLAFARKRFAEALELLSGRRFRNPVDSLRLKTMRLRCHYELGNGDLALQLCDSLEQTLKHNPNLPGSAVQPALNFTAAFRRLATGEGRKAVREFVLGIGRTFHSDWLLEKLKK